MQPNDASKEVKEVDLNDGSIIVNLQEDIYLARLYMKEMSIKGTSASERFKRWLEYHKCCANICCRFIGCLFFPCFTIPKLEALMILVLLSQEIGLTVMTISLWNDAYFYNIQDKIIMAVRYVLTAITHFLFAKDYNSIK